MHIPPVFDYPEAFIFWLVFLWLFSLEILHSGILAGAPLNPQDAGTLQGINIASNIALFLAFGFSFLTILEMPNPLADLYIGTILLAAGGWFRRYSMHILGEYFTAAVTVRKDQPVVEAGPYGWIRHPGYAGGFVMYIGIGVALGNWLSLAVFLAEITVVYSWRIAVEEKALVETIGEPYRRYMKRTKRLIPYIL